MPRTDSTRRKTPESDLNSSDNDKNHRLEMIIATEDTVPGEENYVLALSGTQQ